MRGQGETNRSGRRVNRGAGINRRVGRKDSQADGVIRGGRHDHPPGLDRRSRPGRPRPAPASRPDLVRSSRRGRAPRLAGPRVVRPLPRPCRRAGRDHAMTTTTRRAPPFVPACMSSDDLAAWREMNERLNTHQRATRPCEDCIPGSRWHNDALARRACNGSPGRRVEDDDAMTTRRRRMTTTGQWRRTVREGDVPGPRSRPPSLTVRLCGRPRWCHPNRYQP